MYQCIVDLLLLFGGNNQKKNRDQRGTYSMVFYLLTHAVVAMSLRPTSAGGHSDVPVSVIALLSLSD
jgi:hypothetical protein